MEDNSRLIKLLQDKVLRLEKENTELKAEAQEIIKVVMQIVGVLGLLDESGTKVKAELLNGEEGVFSLLLSSLSDIIGLITKSKMPMIGARYEKQLEQKFAFVKEILPLIQKYSTEQK
jgi:hypothetical protein